MNYPFEIIHKNVSEKFFNVMAKNVVSETNSLAQQEEIRFIQKLALLST